MDKDPDKEVADFMEDFASDLGYGPDDENIHHHNEEPDSGAQRKILVIGGTAVIILVFILGLFFGGGNKVSTEDLNSLRASIARLEKRVAALPQSTAKTDKSAELLTKRLDKLVKKVDSLEKRMVSIASVTKASPSAPDKSVSQVKDKYHKVRTGESLYKIAKKCGISVDELCRLNHISLDQAIHPGQKLLIARSGKE